MSGDDPLDDDDDLNLTYVPKSQRTAHRPSDKRTCYEVTRDAKVSRILQTVHAEAAGQTHPNTDHVNHNDAVPAREAAVCFSSNSPSASPNIVQVSYAHTRRPPSYSDDGTAEPVFVRARAGEGAAQGDESRATTTTTTPYYHRGRGDGIHRGRYMSNRRGSGNPSDPQEQQRQRTNQRNMYILRNALKEVDPSTKELVQLTPAPADVVVSSRGHARAVSGQDGFSRHHSLPYSRGSHRGGRGYRGRGAVVIWLMANDRATHDTFIHTSVCLITCVYKYICMYICTHRGLQYL